MKLRNQFFYFLILVNVAFSQDKGIYLDNGNIGIHTKTPTEEVHIKGQVKIDNKINLSDVLVLTPQNTPPESPDLGTIYHNSTGRLFIYTQIGWREISLSTGPVSMINSTESLVFDGTDDYIDLGEPALIDNMLTGAYSISAWFKVNAPTAEGGRIVAKYASSGSYFLLVNQVGSVMFGHNKASDGSEVLVSSTSNVMDDTWHHVLAVNDGTDLKIYIDGVLDATGTGLGGASSSTPGVPNTIGKRFNYNNSLFNGWIDEVAFFNQDVSAEVASIYNNGAPGDLNILTNNPILWYRLGESPDQVDVASSIHNVIADAHHGTAVGMTNEAIVSDTPSQLPPAEEPIAEDPPADPPAEDPPAEDPPADPPAAGGVSTQSIAFDGNDDYINIGENSVHDAFLAGPYSISVWFKTSDVTAAEDQKWIVNRYSGSGSYLILITSTGRAYFAHTLDSSGAEKGVMSDLENLDDDNWHHLLVVNDGVDLKLYIDGQLDKTATGDGGATQVFPGKDTEIGQRGYFSNRWKGNLDELAYFDQDMSAEIATLYNSGAPSDLSALTQSPIAWYKLGEGDDLTVGNGVKDASANGLDATASNMDNGAISSDVPVASAPEDPAEDPEEPAAPSGPYESTEAITFDGTDDYINLKENTVMDTMLGDTYSISVWFKTPDVTVAEDQAWIVSRYTSTGSYALLVTTNGALYFTHNQSSSGTEKGVMSQTSGFDDNAWHHALIVNDGADIKIYIDGQLDKTGTGMGGASNVFAGMETHIGQRGNHSRRWKGALDELAYFDKDMSSEVTTLYNNGDPGDLSALTDAPIAWYKLGEGDDVTTDDGVLDSSTSANHGTGKNMAGNVIGNL